MSIFRRKPKHPQVMVKSVRPADNFDDPVSGGQLYEIIPVLYSGPWKLEVGAVLEVVEKVRSV